MPRTFVKVCNYTMLLLFLAIAIVTVGTSGNTVKADPCIAQLSYPIMPTIYNYASNIQVIVPVSVTCTSLSSQLTAAGDAYDTALNNDQGTVNTVLTPVNGGTYSGQLSFSLPPTSLGHSVQISVSIYNGGPYAPGQYGTLLTTATETVQVNPTNYPNTYYPPNQYVVQQQTTVTAYAPQVVQQPAARIPSFIRQNFGRQNTNTSWLMGLVVALVIALSIIVAVAFAVIAARNRQHSPWPQQNQNRRY